MRYKVEFFDYWHLGSGAGAGPSLDALVVKDEYGLAYLPGKTIKGLIREMAELLDATKTKSIFGDKGSNMAESYFSNATLDKESIEHLIKNPMLKKHLYSKVTSTKIGLNGIAKDKTLRDIEVVIPITLVGEIESRDDEFIKKAMAMIKQIGLRRNRGLGRCQIGAIR